MPSHRHRPDPPEGQPLEEQTSGAPADEPGTFSMPDCDDSTAGRINYLRSLPSGATVRWTEDTMGPDDRWTVGYVDVDLIGAGGSGAFTILSPGHPDAADCPRPGWQMAAECDLDVHGVWTRDDLWVKQYATRPGDTPSPAQQAELVSAAVEYGSMPTVTGGWSPERISEILRAWASRWAGRDDLRFAWDPDWRNDELADRINTTTAAFKAGTLSLTDMGDGLMVTDEVFEVLAADPDGELTRKIKDATAGAPPADPSAHSVGPW